MKRLSSGDAETGDQGIVIEGRPPSFELNLKTNKNNLMDRDHSQVSIRMRLRGSICTSRMCPAATNSGFWRNNLSIIVYLFYYNMNVKRLGYYSPPLKFQRGRKKTGH